MVQDIVDYLSDIYGLFADEVDIEDGMKGIEFSISDLHEVALCDDDYDIETLVEDIIETLQSSYDFYFDYTISCGWICLIPLI